MRNFRNGFTPIIILIIVAVIAALGVGGYVALRKGQVISDKGQGAQQTTGQATTTPEPSVPADWKTYANTKYGFEFKYPQGFFTLDTSYPYNFTEIEFSALPKTINDACDNAKAEGGQSHDSQGRLLPPSCELRGLSQEEILSLETQVKNLPVGQSVAMPNGPYTYKRTPDKYTTTVITLGNQKGIFTVAVDEQDVGTHIVLYWIDSKHNLLKIYRELNEDSLSQAIQGEGYRTFLQILSTFKFIH